MSRVFNGTSDRIDLANEANFDFERTDPFSVAIWTLEAADQDNPVLAKAENTGRGWGLYRQTFGTQTMQFDLFSSDGNSLDVYTVDSAIPLNRWNHICATYDGSVTIAGVNIYVNGVIPTGGKSNPDQNTLTTTILNDIPVQLGCRGGSSSPSLFFNGIQAGLGIWNVELTAGNVTTLATGADPLTVQNANLIAALPLCGLLSPEPDVKNGNNGTLFGTTGVNGPSFFQGCPVDHGSAVEWLIKA